MEKMFQRLLELSDKMGQVSDGLKAIQVRHENPIADASGGENRMAFETKIDAILGLLNAMADAQILSMEMGRTQLATTVNEMKGFISFGED